MPLTTVFGSERFLMFDSVSSKLTGIIRKITGAGVISEKNIEDAIKDIRMSLLESDVNYKVVKNFIDDVKTKALGEEVLKSLSPDKKFIKIVHDELVKFLGDKSSSLNLTKSPVLIMLVGLQGSGKTTAAAKLAKFLKDEKNINKIMLVGADTYRPAAKEQLKKLAGSADASFYTEAHDDAVKISKNAFAEINNKNYDAGIFDTAGRLHVDETMMSEIKKIREIIPFTDILLVADSMLGQESVNVAANFNEAVSITGIILTKTDGDARGGAALSMKYTVNVPIKFIGTGEKIDKFENFYPERIASRMLDMGDVVSLVEKVQKNISVEDAKKAEEKFRKASFTLDDFLKQMQAMKNLGPMDEILKMLPGAGSMGLSNMNFDEKEMKHIEAIILSMTPKERNHPEIIESSRKKRIAKGSGVSIERVNKLLKQFDQVKKMMKQAGKRHHGGPMPGMQFPGFPGL